MSPRAPRTLGEGLRSRPCSSRVRYSTLMPARVASSERRSPGVRRRKPAGRPTSAGVTASRRVRKKAPNSLSFTSRTYNLSLRGGGPCHYYPSPGLPPLSQGPQDGAMSNDTSSNATATSLSALPLTPGEWELDPHHAAVNFTVRHLGISKVRGRFTEFTAGLYVGEDLDDVRVTAEIALASIDTGNADRDAHTRSAE